MLIVEGLRVLGPKFEPFQASGQGGGLCGRHRWN